MKIIVNGRERDVRDGLTVAELLAGFGTGPSGVAVACNDEVVRRSSYDSHRVHSGDRIEIIKAVAGG